MMRSFFFFAILAMSSGRKGQPCAWPFFNSKTPEDRPAPAGLFVAMAQLEGPWIEMEIGGELKMSDVDEFLDALRTDRMSLSMAEFKPAQSVSELMYQARSYGSRLRLYTDYCRHEADNVEYKCTELGLSFYAWIDKDTDGERSVRYWILPEPVKFVEVACRRVTADRQLLVLLEDLWEDLELPFVSVAEMKRTLKERFEPVPPLPDFRIVED